MATKTTKNASKKTVKLDAKTTLKAFEAKLPNDIKTIQGSESNAQGEVNYVRSTVRKATRSADGRDAFGCRLTAKTNVQNAALLSVALHTSSNEFDEASTADVYGKLLNWPDDWRSDAESPLYRVRPFGPHMATLASNGYVEHTGKRGLWRLTKNGVQLIVATLNDADDADMLATVWRDAANDAKAKLIASLAK